MQVTDRNGASELANVKWRKPVAMLVNGSTRSGKEILMASRNISLARSSVAERRELSLLRRRSSLAAACCCSRSRTCGSMASGWKALASYQRSRSELTRPP